MERPIVTSVQLKRLNTAEVTGVALAQAAKPTEPHLRSVPADPAMPRRRRARKTRLTVYLSVDVIDTLRNIAYWTKGATLAGLVEEALRDSIAARERANGGPFMRRLQELKGGRPRRRMDASTA
ncbi:MAG TPA: hypothetical protein VFA38_00140 [Nitrospirales bacterium]|nr:hypothetical protein [Nitrospirales bacterium]